MAADWNALGWAAALGAAALLLVGILLYNRLVADRNLVRQGFADIDVQLKRRADLVPQLVETVRGYAAYEKGVLGAVVALRASALAAKPLVERFQHEHALGERLQQLVLLQENYPQLKADAVFRDLSARLVEIEDHLQHARRFYNGAVQQYLTHSQAFPGVIVAHLWRFEPTPFFETSERQAVQVAL
ncbi:MAG TPA: LemA family protein [Burkholderiales bacterium]|nr:LemA family protein [Burkholderiales bacterium]